jgi:alpha-galactosidase
MDVIIRHSAPAATSMQVPAFPLVRFDTGLVVYQEALIDGQYLVANTSAMGRPKPHEWVWQALHGGAAGTRPLRTRQHAFRIEADGQLLADRWEWVEAREPEPDRAGCRESVIVLRHAQRPVAVEIHTRLDDTPFLVRWLVITNTGTAPVALSRVDPWAGQVWEPAGQGVDNSDDLAAYREGLFSLGRFAETDWGTEGSFEWMPLPRGSYGYGSLNGRSGWGTPCFLLRNEVTGETAVVDFACSGNWHAEFYNEYEAARRSQREARLYAAVGLAGPAPLRVLAPGESAATPEVHLGFLFGDLDACVQALHAHERRSVILPQPAGREHRVEVNHTGYTRNAQITDVQLREEIDVAADVGVELFMLDAGWFGEVSEKWWEAVGDWDKESPLLTSGVRAAFDYAHGKGMLVGLWVEAERMGPASRLLQAHPEWAMTKRGERIPNLDLSKPEVAAYLEEMIGRLIVRYDLDCFRLDYNISIGEGGEAERAGYTENVVWRYYDALHGIFDRVRQRFPGILLENCSSGGGRTDLGMMSRFHFTQVTDRWSPGPQLKIMNGMTLALPPELCMPLIGGISDGVSDIDFMLRLGLFSHFSVSGIFPRMDQRQMVARERWQHTIGLYKRFVRPMLATCRMYHHTPVQRQPDPGEWVVLECASPDAAQGYACIFRLPGAHGDSYHFHPRGLDPSRRYRVTYDNTGRVREVDGGALIDQGLRVPVASAFTSELLLFETL